MQSYPAEDFDVVVVDNGSTEDVRSVVACFPGVRYEFEGRVGSYAARNKGIEGVIKSSTAWAAWCGNAPSRSTRPPTR